MLHNPSPIASWVVAASSSNRFYPSLTICTAPRALNPCSYNSNNFPVAVTMLNLIAVTRSHLVMVPPFCDWELTDTGPDSFKYFASMSIPSASVKVDMRARFHNLSLSRSILSHSRSLSSSQPRVATKTLSERQRNLSY